jgi:type II secretory ATPase GspE/PulE/Tfp pilus assembly ATPase PilB-like protein
MLINEEKILKIAQDLKKGTTLETLEKEFTREQLFQAMVIPFKKKKFTDVIISEKKIQPDELDDIIEKTGNIPSLIGEELVSRKILTEEEVARYLAVVSGFPYIDTSIMEIDDELFDRFEIEMLRKYQFVPESIEADKLSIIISNPDNIEAIENLEAEIGMPTIVKIGSRSGINRLIDHMIETSVDEKILFHDLGKVGELKLIKDDDDEVDEIDEKCLKEEESPVTKLVDSIILKAVRKKASDIHIEIEEKDIKVKYRIDGTLFEVISNLSTRFKNHIISRIKIMANMDIAEKRVPQDGRIKLLIDGRAVDFRVSTLPSIFGETAVIRILDKTSLGLNLELLGFPNPELIKFKRNIVKPYGMILVAGPTGSGKTTTLYSGIEFINRPEEKLITVEDPIEYQIPGIVQVNVNEKKGLTFASGLRSIVRQDPDKIMVGEIRDFETADIAINAALTGHLVFSTIHANNVTDAIGRLINMGIDPHQFVSSFNLILSQRLVKKICSKCRIKQTEFSDEKLKLMTDFEDHSDEEFYMGEGCRDCHHTGYSGREGIFEVLEMTNSIKSMILKRESPIAIKEQARKEGMTTLREAMWQKVHDGETTIDELNRVTFED